MSETTPTDVEEASAPRYHVHVGLFLLTCFTTTWSGAIYRHGAVMPFDGMFDRLADGLLFSAPLMAILLCHEMGHFWLGRRHDVDVSLPYFLPLPPFLGIGTLGAVIAMPPVSDRNKLVDIGAAGPIAGLILALPIVAYGLHISEVAPLRPGTLEGNSIVYFLLKLAVKGQVLPGNGVDVQLHPSAWAGWVGLLVTMLNLLPIGQLDGGHIATAYFGPRHNKAAAWLHRAMLPLSAGAALYAGLDVLGKTKVWWELPAIAVGAGMSWFIWWGLLTAMRRMQGGAYHPPVGDAPLTPGRQRLGVFMLITFVALFMPIPLRATR